MSQCSSHCWKQYSWKNKELLHVMPQKTYIFVARKRDSEKLLKAYVLVIYSSSSVPQKKKGCSKYTTSRKMSRTSDVTVKWFQEFNMQIQLVTFHKKLNAHGVAGGCRARSGSWSPAAGRTAELDSLTLALSFVLVLGSQCIPCHTS
jgi:hypothetical protein